MIEKLTPLNMMQPRRIIIIACINLVYKVQITWHRKYEIKWNIAIANTQEKKKKHPNDRALSMLLEKVAVEKRNRRYLLPELLEVL